MDKKRTAFVLAILFLVQAIPMTGTLPAEVYSPKPFNQIDAGAARESVFQQKVMILPELVVENLGVTLLLPDIDEILKDCSIKPNRIYSPSQSDKSV